MKFSKQFMQDLVYDDYDPNEVSIIENEIYETSRWSVLYEMVFKYQDKFYKTTYSLPATEQQDETAYEYEDDEIDCVEVFPVEKTVVVYKPKQKEESTNE